MQTKTPLLYRMCLRKKMLSEELANKIILKAKHEGKQLYKYICPYCGKYHLTSKPNNSVEIKDDNSIYFIKQNKKKIYKMIKDDYERMKDKENIIFISKKYYDCIPKHNCNIVYTQAFPSMKSILKFCEVK